MPDPRHERALDVLLIVHADHEQNVVDDSRPRRRLDLTSNPYAAIAAGVAALSGPGRGNADLAVLEMLRADRVGRSGAGVPRGGQIGAARADGLRPLGLQVV